MTKEELIVEMQILSLQFKVTCDQMLMVQGYLKQDSKRNLNTWISQGNKLMKILGLDSDAQEEYVGIFTDAMHDQINECRRAMYELEKKNNNINNNKNESKR